MTNFYARHEMWSGISPSTSPNYKGERGYAEVGFVRIGGQEPYFSVLAATDRKLKNNRWTSAYPGRWAPCADHESFVRFFRGVAHLSRYHLWGVDSGPMHYIENSLYWAREREKYAALADLVEQQRAIQAFVKCSGLGVLATDSAVNWETMDQDTLKTWLQSRLPALLARFYTDVEAWQPGIVERARNLGKGA